MKRGKICELCETGGKGLGSDLLLEEYGVIGELVVGSVWDGTIAG